MLQGQAAEDQETECPAVQTAAAELSVQSPQPASMQQAEVQAGQAVPCEVPCAKRSRQPTLKAVEGANPPKVSSCTRAALCLRVCLYCCVLLAAAVPLTCSWCAVLALFLQRQRAAPGQRAVLAAVGPSGSNAAGSRSVEQDSKPRTARKQAVVAAPRKRSSASAKAVGRKEAEQHKEKLAVAGARQAARQEAMAASKLAKQVARQEAVAAKAAAQQAEADGDGELSDVSSCCFWGCHRCCPSCRVLPCMLRVHWPENEIMRRARLLCIQLTPIHWLMLCCSNRGPRCGMCIALWV